MEIIKSAHILAAKAFYGMGYKPFKFRKTVSLNINHYLYLNMIKGNKTLSSLLRQIIVNNDVSILTKAMSRDSKLIDYIYSTPRTKTVKVSIGFKNKTELNKCIKKYTLSTFVNKKLDIVYHKQKEMQETLKGELN